MGSSGNPASIPTREETSTLHTNKADLINVGWLLFKPPLISRHKEPEEKIR
jgi:hypothetical protein